MFAEVVDTIGSMDPDNLVVRLRQVEAERRRLEAEVAVLVAALDRTGAYQADGHASVRGLLRAEVGWCEAEVTGAVRAARLLVDAPVVGESLWNGDIAVAHVRALATARSNRRCGKQLLGHVDELVDIARRLPADDFFLCMRRWSQLADADGAHRDAESTQAERTASFTEHDGAGRLSATGGALDSAEMIEVWRRYCDAEFTADWDTVKAQWGDDACAAQLPRTDAQRRWDALHRIFLDAASTPADAQAPEPLVNIVMDVATFETTLARLRLIELQARGPIRAMDDLPIDQWRCETITGTLVDPVAAALAALHGHVRRVVFDSAGNVTDLGRRRRLFTGPARDAVRLQASRCIWPGCSIPAGRCQSDHLTDWQHQGPTRPDNGAPLCARHNRWKNHGYRTCRDADGTWHTYRPDGTEIGRAA